MISISRINRTLSFLLFLLTSCGMEQNLQSQYSVNCLTDSSLTKPICFITETRGLTFERTYISEISNPCQVEVDTTNAHYVNKTITEVLYRVSSDTVFIYDTWEMYESKQKLNLSWQTLSRNDYVIYSDNMDSLGFKKFVLNHEESIKCY